MTLRLAALAAVFALVGCAVASDELDGVGSKKRDGAVGGDGDDTGGEGDDSSSPAEDSAAADSGSTDTAPIDSGTPCTVLGFSDCMTGAENLGSVSGDTGSTVKTATGTDNKFLRVRVTEDDSSILSAKDLRVRITLSSTPPANFDLYVYLGTPKASGGSIECSSVKDSSTIEGSDDVIEQVIKDNHPLGGSDDSTWVTIEVRSASAVCTGASWSLQVEGNK